ncbi:hypothetical protein C8R44DRAFT_731962 [Mycena epipterygia]|nr:hypothetical protein C8R44DRAFT_731962 [Mycena epipterygia]
MLLQLLLIHALTQNSSFTQGHILDVRAPVDSFDEISSRRRFDIIWGCLTTIFACTWVSVHPNVPPPDRSRLALLLRRMKMMLIAVIAPELIVGFAARQLLASRRFSKGGFSITSTHGFFISMGGFVSGDGHPIATLKQLDNSEYIAAIGKVKPEDIRDKSKGDALSKGVALIQGLWFTAQCIARASQRLPVTELEVATLAFAVVSIFMWLLWWSKPLDVEQPILVGPADQNVVPAQTPLQKPDPRHLHLGSLDRFFGVFTGDYSPYLPIQATSVPTFWAMDWQEEVDRTELNIPFLIELLVGTIFGAIHCVAWNADFPSVVEMWMWRSSALLVAAIPAVLGIFYTFYELSATGGAIEETLKTIGGAMTLVSIALYPIARLFLIIIPFTSLRALPPGAFIDVDWSVYIPHL